MLFIVPHKGWPPPLFNVTSLTTRVIESEGKDKQMYVELSLKRFLI